MYGAGENDGLRPIFYLRLRIGCMGALGGIIEQAVSGLGFELAEAQISNRGRLLRIFIDKPGGISVDDCAEVSRHLTRLFAVEGVDYDRLEVSSPGLDRPLRKAVDFERFSGCKADVRMRLPDAKGRRRFVGRIVATDGDAVTLTMDTGIVELQLSGMERARLVPET